MPRTAADLEKKLCGVGRYTAAAVASIAYQESVGLVDGNVIRVVSRLRKIGADSTSKSSTEAYWRNADDLVDPSRPGDFNQALMELGAIVCTPKNPSCSKCPLKANCQAYSEVTARSAGGDGKQVTASDSIDDIENVPTCNLCIPKTDKYQQELGVTNYPRKGKKAEQRIQKSLVVIIRFGDKYLLTQRPETGLLANLMEFPSLKDLNQEEDCSVKEVKALIGKKTSLVNFEVNRQGEVIHQFSHIKQTYSVWAVEADTQDFKWKDGTPPNLKWLTESEISQSAISTAMKKVFKLKDKKPLTAPNNTKQRSIASFFVKKE